MASPRQTKKYTTEVNNDIVIPVQEYIDKGLSNILDFMKEFKAETEDWRKNRETAHASLVNEVMGLQKTITELSNLKQEIVNIKEDLENTKDAIRDINNRLDNLGKVSFKQLGGWVIAVGTVAYNIWKDFIKK